MTMTDNTTTPTTDIETDTTDDTLSVSTNTVTYMIDKEQSKQIAALHHAASKDTAREVLCGVRIKYSGDVLTFVVTDSYKLVERAYEVGDDKPTRDTVAKVAGCNHGEVIVNAVALKTALATVKTAFLVKLEIGSEGVTVSDSSTSTTIPAIDKQYPNVDRFWNDNSPTETFNVKHIAISAEYLWQLSRSTGRMPKDMGPVVLTGSTELKPIHVRMPGEDNWRALLMPVRI